MTSPNWSDDDPGDRETIVINVAGALGHVSDAARTKSTLTSGVLRKWHREIYEGCSVPSPSYVGNFRGDKAHPDLVGYEVGIGTQLDDGYTEGVGVWSDDVAAAVETFIERLGRAFDVLDTVISAGASPTTADEVCDVVELCAVAHGEWVRIHPFANGNGRTARLLAAHIALRYGLPVFVTLKPRPDDVAYARVSKASMGRPPDFVGDHREATAVFAHLLALRLMET